MSRHFFILPHDVLYLRGNKMFGAAGSYGECMIPPWPSLAAGALRSALLVQDGIDLGRFAAGEASHPTVGKRDQPGTFALRDFQLARKVNQQIETLHPLPADLHVSKVSSNDQEVKDFVVRKLTPTSIAPGVETSAKLSKLAVLATDTQAKPVNGLWLTQAGFADYLAGQVPSQDTLVKPSQLWEIDQRVGVALSASTGSAEKGALFTSEAVALHRDVGFLAVADGTAAMPEQGLLRLGGDGRSASYQVIEHQPTSPSTATLIENRRCRLILTTPGIFAQGWLPPGVSCEGNSYHFDLQGVSGDLVCAALARASVVSGWDLARKQPKAAERVAPAGSVYWLENLMGDVNALCKLANHGLRVATAYDAQRQIEGFNRFVFATY